MVHYTTSNISFLKVSFLLEEMGIENNSFFLELNDESLLNVDPFDPDISADNMTRVITEVANNPWYFVRECVRIPSSGVSQFELHRGNLGLLWCIFNNLDVYNILPRQCYKTFSVAAALLWIMYFGGMRTEMMLYANSDPNLKNNMGRIRALRDFLPKYLQLHNSRVDKDSDDGMVFTALGNSIKKKAPGRSVEAAVNVGRGFSTPIQWYDEFAFIPNIYHQYTSSVFGHMTVAKRAEANGLPHSRILTTTAGYLNTDEGKYAFKFLQECADFGEIMYDMDKDKIKSYIAEASKNGFVRCEFMFYDLGKDENYLEEQKRAVQYDQDAIDREVLNKWKDVSKEHPLGQDLVALLDSCIKEPNKVIVINDIYFLKLYRDIEDIDWDLTYVLGMDCSGNVGRDFTTFTVIDPRNFEVVATMRTNLYSTTRFGKAVLKIMNSIFPNSVLCPERNSMGIAVLDNMIEEDFMINSRIYRDPGDTAPGFKNDKNSRPLIYNVLLKSCISEDFNKIHDRSIINEVHTLTRSRSGRIDHMQGEHDDMLMSYLIARWFISYGLQIDRYINPAIIGVSFSSKEQEKKHMEEVKQSGGKTARAVLYGKNIAKKKIRSSKFDSELLDQFETDDSSSSSIIGGMTNSIGKINTFLDEQRQENVDENIKVVDESETFSDEKNYDKNPGDIRYKTNIVETQTELERKFASSDVSDFKFAMKSIF